ncbi:MAG: methyltransferase domain-containing protein [Thiolinea sp.]
MPDPEKIKQFAGKVLGLYTGAMLTQLIYLGYKTGLFEASAKGAATSEELSERAGLQERYVREWLAAMVTGGIYEYDPATREYTLPEAHAVLLMGDHANNLCPHSQMITHFSTHLPRMLECFEQGGGIDYSEYRPGFTECMDDVWRRIFDDQLVSGFVSAVEGLEAKLQNGIRVLDIGCGTGHALNVLAQAYPQSTFVGYDIAEDAIAAANTEAQVMGLQNVRFEVKDVTSLEGEKFELITAFDAIHDQREPETVLASVRDALADNGTFLMIEFKFNSEVQNNIGNPFAPMYYAFSLMHCTPVSLASGGPGLGACWGEQVARETLGKVGFAEVEVIDSPRPQNYIFVCQR